MQDSLWLRGMNFTQGCRISCDTNRTGGYSLSWYKISSGGSLFIKKLVPGRTNLGGPFILQKMDSLWKFGPPPTDKKNNIDPEHISLAKFGPVAYLGGLLRFLETTQAHKFSSTQCTAASFPAERTQHSFPRTLHNFCERCTRPNEGILIEPVAQFSGYASVDITKVCP